MRFEVSKVLDAIEKRLSTDPALARGVVDLAEVVRYADLDGGRPATLLRLGLVVDALSRRLAEENVVVYVVVDRALLSDADLTSNERMVIRRWADDGLVEVLPGAGDRTLEVADLTGLPVISRRPYDDQRERRPWLGEPGRLLCPGYGPGNATIEPAVPGGPQPPSRATVRGQEVLARLWRCPEPGCAAFGPSRAGRPGGQPPPRLRDGVPVCPRHDEKLLAAGPRPAAEVLVARVDGTVRQRFVVSSDQPVVVGRAPDGLDQGPGVLMLGPWLAEEARRWISRSHVVLEILGDDLVARDVSTNGTVVRVGGSRAESDRLMLTRDQVRLLGDDDVIELYPGVQVARAGQWSSGGVANPSSVMADAPTMMIQLPASD
ncbi:FHA domain-containing protein [Pilimelia columellifera]|uniref:FHA domain-containing protein n=1 Tax=Pilimelia columellifera TaxID=706574 RepID=UPI0031DF2948